MFHSQGLRKISCLHERCLHIVYRDNRSFLEDLLEKDESVSTDVKNVQTPTLEMFKVVKNLTCLHQ